MLGLVRAQKPRGAASVRQRNALRHGLSLPFYANPTLSKEVEELAREIAGTDANAEIRQLACRIAEAHIDLRRVRHARHQFLTDRLNDEYYESRANRRDENGRSSLSSYGPTRLIFRCRRCRSI